MEYTYPISWSAARNHAETLKIVQPMSWHCHSARLYVGNGHIPEISMF
jgi:hypothetical protein